jgi:glycosyltransferase involved in cell wall biosynthesis
MTKIAVVSIAKNEEKFVKTWKESAKNADALYILDTGSSDNTVSIAKELGINVYEAIITPWHFANARNHLLDLLPSDIDWIINLDLDEVLVDGWRAELEKIPNDGSITRPRYNYTWSWNEDGTPGLQYHGDKIVRRFSHRWKGACHEVNITQPGHHETQMFCGLQIHHHADNTKPRSSYLPLLALDVEEDPHNDRNRHYYARELFFRGEIEESVKQFKHHITMPEARWDAERAWSMRYLAKMLPQERESWLLRACAEYPRAREPWFDLAQHYYDKQNWSGSHFAASKALAIRTQEGLYLNEPEPWGWKMHDLYAIAAYNINQDFDAYINGCIALELNPNDARLQKNVEFYMERIPDQYKANYREIAKTMVPRA